MIQKISIFIISVFLFGCGSTKKVTQIEELPAWVKAKPVSENYYVGVGSAYKTPDVSAYQQSAKNNALADLTSEIKVEISTSSVLHKFESSLGYSEDFSAATKASTNELIEGYELVNTYESETNYYVQYQLSKQKYVELKAQRKNDAEQKATDYYSKAVTFASENNYYQALLNYVKGLESVKPYFSESLEITYNHQNIDLGNELFNGYQQIMKDIFISPVKTNLKAKKGETISSDDLTFKLHNASQSALVGIPVVFSLGKLPLVNNKVASNIQGEVSYQLNQIQSKADQVFFIAQLDLNTLATGLTYDPFFRKIIRKTEAPKGQVIIELQKPTFYVSTTELNFGKTLANKPIENKVQQLLVSRGYFVSDSPEKADYHLEIELNTTEEKHEGKMYYAQLAGTFKIYNRSKELIYIRPIKDINGVQLSYADAGLKAYNNLMDYLGKNLHIKLREALN